MCIVSRKRNLLKSFSSCMHMCVQSTVVVVCTEAQYNKRRKKNHFLHYKRKRTAFSINFFSSTHMQTFTHCALTNDNKLQYVVEFFGRNIEIRVHQLQSNHVDQKLLNKIGTYAYELDDGSKKRRKRNQF